MVAKRKLKSQSALALTPESAQKQINSAVDTTSFVRDVRVKYRGTLAKSGVESMHSGSSGADMFRFRAVFRIPHKYLIPAILAFAVGVLCRPLSAESLCVAPASADPPQRCAPGLCGSGELTLKLDDRPVIEWPNKQCVEITGLDAKKRHTVRIYRAGKLQQSFRFSFADYKSKRPCLFLSDLYWTAQLWEPRQAPWCKCR